MSEWYEEGKRPRRSRLPLVVVSAVLLGGGVAAGYFVSRPRPETVMPPAIVAIDEPATLEPFVLGERTPMLDDIFGSRLMNFAIGLDHGIEDEAALRHPEVSQALGPRANGELIGLMAAAKRMKVAANDDDDAVTALDIATARLDNALLAGRLPYFVDTNVIVNLERGSKLVLMYEFTVSAMGLFQSEGSRVRSVRLRRIDKLNWEHTLLGFVNPHRIYAVVLLDQIDELMVRHLLPGLAADSPLALIAFDETPSQTSKTIAARGGEVAREELFTIVSREDALELGGALRARRELFARWRDELKIPVKLPAKLELDLPAFRKDLDGDLSREELDKLAAVQQRLNQPAAVETYRRLRDAFADSIERHEVQHRLDVIRPVRIPKAIDEILPPNAGKTADRKRLRIQAELSAYLAQIGRDEKMARTTYTLLLRFLVDPSTRNTAEASAAKIATEELVTELGIKDVAPLAHDGRLDEERIVRGHTELCRSSSPALAAAARKAWSRIFAAPFPALEPISR